MNKESDYYSNCCSARMNEIHCLSELCPACQKHCEIDVITYEEQKGCFDYHSRKDEDITEV